MKTIEVTDFINHASVSKTLNPIYEPLFDLRNNVYQKCGFTFANLEIEPESEDYSACSFELSGIKIKYRVSKITPTKIGQFVSIWKRSNSGITQPFDYSDDFDLLIITANSTSNFGQFIFPKNILVQQKVITNNGVEGKRGMRVYPPWDKVTSKQATKTQQWQNEYFISFTEDYLADGFKIKKMITENVG